LGTFGRRWGRFVQVSLGPHGTLYARATAIVPRVPGDAVFTKNRPFAAPNGHGSVTVRFDLDDLAPLHKVRYRTVTCQINNSVAADTRQEPTVRAGCAGRPRDWR